MHLPLLQKRKILNQAKKAIDAEQFEKAKSLLKSIIKAKPSDGEANFVLGNVYLNQGIVDSAKIYYNKWISKHQTRKT